MFQFHADSSYTMTTTIQDKPTLTIIGCSWMTYTILEELAQRNTLPYGKIALFDSRPTTHLERTRLTKWHPLIDPTNSPKEEKAPRFTMSQLCRSTFADTFKTKIPIEMIENFIAEFPANRVIHNRIIIYTEIGCVAIAMMKRIEDQIDTPHNLYYLFQNGLFGIYKHGFVWKYKYQKTYLMTPQKYELSKEGCDIYIDYMRMIKHHKEDIYVLPERFYRYKLMAQCIPLGTIMAMMFLTGKPLHSEFPDHREQWIQYPTVFDYSALYGDKMIELPKLKDDTHAIFDREQQTILRERVHWIQSRDQGSTPLLQDLLMFLQWSGIYPGKYKTTRIYLNLDEEKRPSFIPEDHLHITCLTELENTHPSHCIRNVDWIWRLDTCENSARENAYLNRYIYDYRKNSIILSQTDNNTSVDIAIPRHFTLPSVTKQDHSRILEKRMMLAFGFMNWVQLIKNSLYIEQFTRSYQLDENGLSVRYPEEPRRITCSTELATIPHEFTEWYRWKADYYKDGCDTVRNLLNHIQETYEVLPIKIHYEVLETGEELVLYEKKEIDGKRQLDLQIISWIKRHVPVKKMARHTDMFRFILTCKTDDDKPLIVPPLYYIQP
jgi:hypothetical protein